MGDVMELCFTAEEPFPLPVLPEALWGLDPAEVLRDASCELIGPVVLDVCVAASGLESLVPVSSGPYGSVHRFSGATKIVIARIYSCLPYGLKKEYLALLQVKGPVIRKWRKLRCVGDGCLGQFGLPEDVVEVLRGLPQPVPKRLLTAEVKRCLVIGWAWCDYGMKGKFLSMFGVTRWRLDQWRAGLADGDLDNDIIPRQVGRMTCDDIRDLGRAMEEISRLQKENARLQRTVDSMGDGYVPRKKMEQLEEAIDILGKAIASMPKPGGDHGAEENASPDNNNEPTTWVFNMKNS